MATPPDNRRRPALDDVLAGLLALTAASVLVHLSPLRVTLAVVGALKRTCHRSAHDCEAQRVVDAGDWAARYLPGRVACMERSLAAFLMCCAKGAQVDWCLGCRFDPCEAHAWIETAGRPTGEPNRPDRPLYVTLRV